MSTEQVFVGIILIRGNHVFDISPFMLEGDIDEPEDRNDSPAVAGGLVRVEDKKGKAKNSNQDNGVLVSFFAVLFDGRRFGVDQFTIGGDIIRAVLGMN